MKIRGRVISFGILAPQAGEHREAFLEWKGIEALQNSYRLYGDALLDIGISLCGDLGLLPRPHNFYSASRYPLIRDQARQAEDSWQSTLSKIGASFWGRKSSTSILMRQIERKCRESLNCAVTAFNYLEDNRYADWAHQHAHNIAAIVSGIFGCMISYNEEDGVYLDTCPLSMMHHRWGMSMGFSSKRTCSICSEDIDECPHMIDQRYPVSVEKKSDGRCSACGSDSCDHTEGETVETYPSAVMGEIDLREVSFVRRPRDPLARPTEIEIDMQALRLIRPQLKPGDIIVCRRCLGGCVDLYDPWSSGLEDPPLTTSALQGFTKAR